MNWLSTFLFSIIRPALGLIILAGLLMYWFFKKKLPQERYLKIFCFGFSIMLVIRSFVLTCLNYWIWSQDSISYRLLPPHNPISYFLKYSWQHYWFEPVVSILFALIVFLGIYWLNRRFEENLFYNEEKYLASLGVLIIGWPNCLIYLCLVLLLGLLIHFLMIVFNLFKEIKDSRFSFLYLWLPCALLVLFLNDIINTYLGINIFNI